jgi:hypothetical protein
MSDSLDGFIILVKNLLNWNHVFEADMIGRYVNTERNYLIRDKKHNKTYFLKWEREEFKAAGTMVPEIGKGPGRTISLEMFNTIVRPTNAIVLFGLGGSDMVQYIECDELLRLGERYQQSNHEWVWVVSSKSLKSWGGLRRGI